MANYVAPSNTTLALNISNIAQKYIQDYLGTPKLNGIPIWCSELTDIVNSDVSEHMIIDSTGGRLSYSDNIALRPREWQIKGFLKGSPLEITNSFQPSLQFQKQTILTFRTLRQPITFFDNNQNSFQVFMTDLEFPQAPDTQNVQIINVTLKEINVLNSVLGQSDAVKQAGTSPSINVSGAAANIGNTSAQLSKVTQILTGIVSTTDQANALLSGMFSSTYTAVDKKGNAATFQDIEQ